MVDQNNNYLAALPESARNFIKSWALEVEGLDESDAGAAWACKTIKAILDAPIAAPAVPAVDALTRYAMSTGYMMERELGTYVKFADVQALLATPSTAPDEKSMMDAAWSAYQNAPFDHAEDSDAETRKCVEAAVRAALATAQADPEQAKLDSLAQAGLAAALENRASQPAAATATDIEFMLADYHKEVWDAAQSDKPDYDYAGRETAKKLVAAIRALAALPVARQPQAAPELFAHDSPAVNALDDLIHEITGDEGEDDPLTYLRGALAELMQYRKAADDAYDVKKGETLAIQAAPEAPIDPAFVANLARSRAKYPNNRSMLDGLCGELHELKRAYNGDGDVRAEAFDVAVCAYRLAVEGDAGDNKKLDLIPDSLAWGAAPEATSEQPDNVQLLRNVVNDAAPMLRTAGRPQTADLLEVATRALESGEQMGGAQVAKYSAYEIADACVKAGLGILECNSLIVTLKATTESAAAPAELIAEGARKEAYEQAAALVLGSHPKADRRGIATAIRLLAKSRAAEGEATERKPLTDAARDVLAERQRQVEQEGWTPDHDDKYKHGQMRYAAAAYVLDDHKYNGRKIWPWPLDWWKPRNERRNVVKAGALILAEIERMDRIEQHHGIGGGKND